MVGGGLFVLSMGQRSLGGKLKRQRGGGGGGGLFVLSMGQRSLGGKLKRQRGGGGGGGVGGALGCGPYRTGLWKDITKEAD